MQTLKVSIDASRMTPDQMHFPQLFEVFSASLFAFRRVPFILLPAFQQFNMTCPFRKFLLGECSEAS